MQRVWKMIYRWGLRVVIVLLGVALLPVMQAVPAQAVTPGYVVAWGNNGARESSVPADLASVTAVAAATGHSLEQAADVPVITEQPADQTVNAGDAVTLYAAGSGTGPLRMEWQVSTDNGATWASFSGTFISYSTQISYRLIFFPGASDNGNLYRAVITNSAGTTTTNVVTLTVNFAPIVATQPANQTVNAGDTASFSVAASGNPAPTVQWQVSTDGTNWSDLSGATNATLSFAAAAGDSGKQYHAVFTNVFGSATTNAATLTVNTPPAITTQPGNQTVNAGGTASFSAAASGNPSPNVQWQVSTDGGATFNNIAGATDATLSFAAAATDNGKQYRAVFTNAAGSVNSNAATLTVNSAPVVATQPANQTVNAGQQASFSAAASGNPAPTVQWQVSTDGVNWGDLSGATSATLSFAAAATDNGKQYRAVFTNVLGSATTSAAKLTVNTLPPTIAVAAGGTCAADGTANGSINLTVGSSAGVNGLTLKVVSNSNATLVPNSNVVFGGSGANRTLTVTAAPKKFGRAALSIGVSDGVNTTAVPVTVIVGRNDENVLIGASGADLIFGRNDTNILYGNDGNDLLCGGGSADWLIGGSGDDTLFAGKGNDLLTGGPGADRFSGGPGKDIATDFTAGQGDTQDGTVELFSPIKVSIASADGTNATGGGDATGNSEPVGPNLDNRLYLPSLQK